MEPDPDVKAEAAASRLRVIEDLAAEHPGWAELEIHDALVQRTGSGAVPEEIWAVMGERR